MVLGRAPRCPATVPLGGMGLKGPTGGGPTSAQSHVGLTMPGLGALPAQYPAPDLLNAAKFEVRFAFTSRSH